VIASAPRTSKPAAKTGAGPTAKTTPSTATSPGRTTPTTSTTPTVTPAAATPPGITTWPASLSEWTVVLARYPDQATANATALRVKAEGLPAGVLNSSDHPSLKPGGWLVFTGRYPNRAQAAVAAQRLRGQGHTARARRVAPTRGQ
jgi:cell division septation protein DedD